MVDHGRIKKARTAAGLSQADAAKRAGIGSRQAWSKIESGREGNMSIQRLEKIARALGVKAKNLLK